MERDPEERPADDIESQRGERPQPGEPREERRPEPLDLEQDGTPEPADRWIERNDEKM